MTASDTARSADEARPEDPTRPAGTRSLLPLSDDAYLTSTANTREDLARLAPIVPALETADGPDPTLEVDLEAWDDPSCPRPRLQLLGPVTVTASGDRYAAADRKPLLTAIFAFIALHPGGVTSEEIGATANVARSDARSKTAVLRSWIGDDPQTGEPYIPRGERSQRRNGAPPFRYVVRDALIDADLFLRLHARAARRGADGVDDLINALDLVTGLPLDGTQKDEHWQWARNVEHLDARLSAAVADVAHLVITYALVEKDTGLARRAYDVGHAADPEGEVLQADLVLIELIEGHPEKADAVVQDMRAHVDDEGWPSEPTPRTKALLERLGRHEEPAQRDGADRVSAQ